MEHPTGIGRVVVAESLGVNRDRSPCYTQRRSMAAAAGYSSLSKHVLSNVSAINFFTSGSTQVVTKVALG